ncbi:MAG: metal ABC transporter substrate-binding protein [Christensenellales bacterium]
MKTKKLLAALLTLLIFLSPAFAAAETVVTSFYPIYLFALNLTQGIDGITIRNLAAPNTGCLHDYQLSTGDMKVLNKADVFLINGAGMESYLTRVMDTFPKLPVVDASAGITLLTEDGMDEYVDDHDMT